MSAGPLVSPRTRYLHLEDDFELESGTRLPGVRVAYRTWGRLDEAGSNGVLVCHALTGSADADDWWGPLFGPGRSLDPERDFIVCANVLGSCYGTTGPADEAPGRGRPWGPDFPAVTIRDMVRLQAALLDHLKVRRLRLVIGGSMGGMQVLEWAAMYPERVAATASIAASGRHSAWCIGLSEAQRRAIEGDPAWRGGRYAPDAPPVNGLAVARMIAMCSYRSWRSFSERFSRQTRHEDLFEVESYLRYQGEKLVHRFDANSYLVLTRAMDRHDLGRDRGSYEQALAAIRPPSLVVSITSDVLYPPAEQEELAALMPEAVLAHLPSVHGHDGFLIHVEWLNQQIVAFRRQQGEWAEPGAIASDLRGSRFARRPEEHPLL
ncbi:MAG: homoserine O-acetyltransferase [bacterium]|nr:homoserine O-acetyltransferase [bacterium]